MNAHPEERHLRLPLALRLAWRDIGGGFAGFRIFIACIILGVTAIVGIGSTTQSLLDSISREGRRILGGDASFTTILRDLDPAEANWLAAHGRLLKVGRMRAMARNSAGKSALVEIKAVGDGYPSFGKVVTSPQYDGIDGTLSKRDGAFGLFGDPMLEMRLNLRPGDPIKIGDTDFIWRGAIKSMPDSLSGGFTLAPHVLISLDAFRNSNIVQPGSLVRWTNTINLTQPSAPAKGPIVSGDDIAAFVEQANRQFPQAGWRVATREHVSPGFAKNLGRFTQFLTLVALTAMVIGGLGIANAVRGFVDRKRSDFAVLKALGAPGSYVFVVALTEVAIAITFGVATGLVIGAALPFVLHAILGAAIPLPFAPGIYLKELLLGLVYGYLATLIFSIAPLGRVHTTPVAALFRNDSSQSYPLPKKVYLIFVLLASALFLVTIVWTASDRRTALVFLLATAGIFAALQLIGLALAALIRRAPRTSGTEMRLALSNLGRPGALTRPVITSVGLSLALFAALTNIDANIREPLREGLPGQTPSFFFTDIQPAQLSQFRSFLTQKMPNAKSEFVPILRGRIVKLKGLPTSQIRAKENVAWALEGDRGITFSNVVPAGSKLLGGSWWNEQYRGPPLVSMESEVAEGLGLSIGDKVALNVLGREIEATVANIREVNWRSYGINFVFVFTPSTFDGAPHTWLATATFPNGGSQQSELRLVDEFSNAFPAITTIRVKESLEAVVAIADQLSTAIRSATFLTLFASTLVLAGALAAGQRARLYDAVVLKVLGATRRQLMTAYGIEFSILGIATAIFALALGAVAARFILQGVLSIPDYHWSWRSSLLTIALSLVLVVCLGFFGTWRILGQSAAKSLRNR